jgi:hypothetical protein
MGKAKVTLRSLMIGDTEPVEPSMDYGSLERWMADTVFGVADGPPNAL